MEAAIYARVSTERQDLQQTIDSQVAILTAWVRQQAYRLAYEHIYCDRGFSGARLDRPALDRLRRQNERLARELERTQTALDITGKVHALLEQLSESADTEPRSKPWPPNT